MTIEERNFLDFSSIKSPKELIEAVRENPERLTSIGSNLNQLSGEMIHALIGMDGFTLAEERYWAYWKGLLIEIACDGSGHVALFPVVIKRCCSVLASDEGQVGKRAAEVLAILATLIPNCVSAQLLVGLEAACPYWKASLTTTASLQSYFRSLLFLAETLPVLQDKILEFLLCQVILPLDLAVCNEQFSSNDSVNEKLEAETEESGTPTIDANFAEKLEACLQEVHQFLQEMSKATDRFRDLCYSMIRMFDKSVLNANQPRKTVQVLLKACQLDGVVTDRFLGFLTASLFARDAQLNSLSEVAEFVRSNNAMDARVLMSLAAIIFSFCARHGQISSTQQSTTAHLLLQWLERKAEALEIYHDALFSKNGDFLNPFEVSVCAAVWQALLSIVLLVPEHESHTLLERINALAPSLLISALTLVNEATWSQFTLKFDCSVLAEAKSKFLTSIKASRQRRQRESLQKCIFKADGYDSYAPLA